MSIKNHDAAKLVIEVVWHNFAYDCSALSHDDLDLIMVYSSNYQQDGMFTEQSIRRAFREFVIEKGGPEALGLGDDWSA